MKVVKTTTTAKDVLSLVDYFCAHKHGLSYKLCNEKEIRLEHSDPGTAPKWIVPVTFTDNTSDAKTQIKYFIFDHEFCSLFVQDQKPRPSILSPLKSKDDFSWVSSFYHWIVEKDANGKYVVKTVFNIPKTCDPVPLPDYLGDRCFFEYNPRCPVLFLTGDDVIDAFPFREVVNHAKNIELKVTSYNEPVWLLTQKNGKEYVIYPFALHRFYDELDITHKFGELRNPKRNEEFLVYHEVSGTVVPLISLKAKDNQNLSIVRFSKMKL